MDYEWYATPAPLTQWLFAWMAQQPFPLGGTIFDPCCGDRAIPAAAPALKWLVSDFDPRWMGDHPTHDATELAVWRGRPAWTVSNFPFSLTMPILRHALTYSRVGVAIYTRLSLHEPTKTNDRCGFMEAHPPTAILSLPRVAHQRSRTTGKWATDNVTSCWTIWVKDDPRQLIAYAPLSVIDALDDDTPAYRERMDALNGLTGIETHRRAAWIARWAQP